MHDILMYRKETVVCGKVLLFVGAAVGVFARFDLEQSISAPVAVCDTTKCKMHDKNMAKSPMMSNHAKSRV
jgi:hypothetical protein